MDSHLNQRRKSRGLVVLIASLIACTAGAAAQTAQTRFYCLSLRFQQGTDQSGLFTLDLSTVDSPGLANGELAPTYDQPTHFSGFRLYDGAWETTVEGWIEVNVPLSKDDNQNGFADFFEVSQSVSGTTSGSYLIPGVEAGTARATWSRAGGAREGTCVIQMTGSTGPLSPFTHTFELLEYTGPLSYAPGTNQVTGTVDLRQTGAPQNRFVGPIAFAKSAADPYNRLELQAGGWTNALGERLTFLKDSYLREIKWPTNYFGFLEFDDGDLSTPELDFYDWALSIDDVNDADQDGVPDFSDDPGAAPPRAPTVGVSLTASAVVLSISGTVGRVHEIQEATSLSLKDWKPVQSVTLGSDPQTVSLTRPAAGEKFWRVRVVP